MIGILDWGIGGMGFYRELRRRSATVPVAYVSDAGYTPYGKVPRHELARRVAKLCTGLRALGARHIVLACNAASSTLPQLGVSGLVGALQSDHGPIEVTGVVAHGVRLVRAHRARVVGVIGGERTIRSGAYRRALASPRRRIVQRIAQPLSAHVEAGVLESAALSRDLDRILAPLRNVDALLLACTHYPAIARSIATRVPGVDLLDPVGPLVRWVTTTWPMHHSRFRGAGDRFLTTGSVSAMRRAARTAFAVELSQIERWDV